MTKSYTELLGIHQGYIKMWEVLTSKVTPHVIDVKQVKKGDRRSTGFLNEKKIAIT